MVLAQNSPKTRIECLGLVNKICLEFYGTQYFTFLSSILTGTTDQQLAEKKLLITELKYIQEQTEPVTFQ